MAEDRIEFDNEDDNWMLAAPDFIINNDGTWTLVSTDRSSLATISTMSGLGQEHVEPQPSTSNAGNNDAVEKQLYEVLSSNTMHSEKFNTKITETSIQLKKMEKNPGVVIKQTFDNILKKELRNISERDQVGIILNNKDFNKPMYVTLRQHDQLTSDVILAEAEKIIQSNEEFFLSEPLDVKITTVHLPSGQRGKSNYHILPFDDYCEKRPRSIVIIKNRDNLCLPRAIVVGKAFIERAEKKISTNQYYSLVRSEFPQKSAAENLCKAAIPGCIGRNGCIVQNFIGDLYDVDKFQEYFENEFELTVFDGSNREGKNVLYKGNTGNTRYIDLFLDVDTNHYSTITSVTGAFALNYYCRQCCKGYSNKGEHRCVGRCKNCGSITACEPEENFNTKCDECNIYFTSSQCLANHQVPKLEGNKSICNVTKYCYHCMEIYTLNRRKTTHKCWYKLCKICSKYVPKDHLCYIQKLKTFNSKLDDNLFIFFDFEARVENGIHIPNFCVIQNQCQYCNTNNNMQEECDSCFRREYIIDKEGDELMDEFFAIISRKSEYFKRVIVFAHNGGGYDFQFIAKYMIMKKKWIPKIIKNGSKIMSMEYRNLHFKDTLYFFGCRLSALPKMFDIKETMKGYFPHFFNLPENQEYRGAIPHIKFYGPDFMNTEERRKFLDWHAEQKGEFDFKQEMTSYCRADVDILREAALKFRKLFIELLDVDPLASTITIASACMKGYRQNFLPENMIAVMPFKTYHMQDNQSKMALRYLYYLEQKYGIILQSAYRGREKEFGKYKVDGYYAKFPTAKLDNFDRDNDTREEVELIIEVQGCLFHGCLKCYSGAERYEPVGDPQKNFQTLQHRYENTVKKMDYLRKLSTRPYILEIWECEIRSQCTNDEVLRKIMTDADTVIRIESNREAFFGGRTECFRNYYKVKPGEEIRYIDVNSLYPYVNKYGVYPIGHPEILLDDEAKQCDFHKLTGIAKVKILPPKQQLFPVLPVRVNNKLIFPLCRTCAEYEHQQSCTHEDEQRELVGTYTCIELAKALELEYKLKQVYEVWSYNSTQYDHSTKAGGLFAQYIDKFLKIKQAASGYPSHVETDIDKLEFCRKFREKENIDLSPNEVEFNPGMRALSKLCLNSLWGKFGQRNNMQQTSIINETHKFTELVINPEKEIIDISILKSNTNVEQQPENEISLVSWKVIEECTADESFINPIISAYVTAQARLYLHSFLQRLGDRVLYCDTDSVIYVYREGDTEIETGPYLGEMSNELDGYGNGCYISEFVCEGPKNYSYKVVDKDGNTVSTTAKVRGFTLNFSASQKLNFETMKDFVTGENSEPILVTEPYKIQRKRHFELVTQAQTKKYGEISSKRRQTMNFETVPYGFVDNL